MIRGAKPNRIPAHTAGFTLLELLVVIGIVGVMAAVIGYYSYVWVQTNRLREAAQQVVTDLQRARSQAQLTSEDSQVSLCTNIVPACVPPLSKDVYTTSWGASGSGNGSGTRTLPYGIKIMSLPASAGNNSITYSAPNAETDAIGIIWQVTSPSSAVNPLFIKVVSVTGKVVLSATN